MTIQAFALISILIGLLTYVGLTLFFLVGLIRGTTGRAALLASGATTAWLTTLIMLGDRPATHLLEATSLAAWGMLACRILGVSIANVPNRAYRTQTLLAALLLAVYSGYVVALTIAGAGVSASVVVIGKLALCTIGLVLVEQINRNTRRDYRWNLKLLVIGLGIIFAYGFVLHADTLLFRAISVALVTPHGIVLALAAPFIVLSSLRNRSHMMNFNISREFVFRSGALVVAGTYLLVMGLAGYYIQFFGGSWGEILQILLITTGLIGLAVIVGSTKVRSAIRVTLLRNLYEYKYDYRDEWLRVTRELTQTSADDELAHRAIHALADLVHSTSGAYWRLSEDGMLMPVSQLRTDWREPFSAKASASLQRFLGKRHWIIDLTEYRKNPGVYPDLDLAADLDSLDGARFLVPLFIQDELFGVIVLGDPHVPIQIIWEDYDILRIVASQVAGFLALHHADEVLAESEQLRSMDQLSAFIVHDLKAVNGQLGLLANNIQRHRNNPAFIDDMLATVNNAERRTAHLLDQLRHRGEDAKHRVFDLRDVCRRVVEECSGSHPVPQMVLPDREMLIKGDEAKLASAVAHIVQNAQDATSEGGKVCVQVRGTDGWITVDVADTGCGMSDEFIAERLFRPFSTTKGLAGIGIGAYQCREYVRGLGGDVHVRSQPGAGTTFTLRLPFAEGMHP